MLSFTLGDAKVPNANGFASQWNIGLGSAAAVGPGRTKYLRIPITNGSTSAH